MRDHIERQYNAQFTSWNEPTDDDYGVQFVCIHAGRVIVADSLALVLAELQAATHQALRLAA